MAHSSAGIFHGLPDRKIVERNNCLYFWCWFRTFGVAPEFSIACWRGGILGALIMRGLMVWAGAELIERFTWIMYVFGRVPDYAGVHMMFFE